MNESISERNRLTSGRAHRSRFNKGSTDRFCSGIDESAEVLLARVDESSAGRDGLRENAQLFSAAWRLFSLLRDVVEQLIAVVAAERRRHERLQRK